MHHSTNRPPLEDPLVLFPKALTKMYSIWASRTYPFASIGRDVSFHFTSKLCRQRASRISIGNSVKLLEYAWINAATEDPVGDPTVIIEDGCSIGFGSIVSGKNCVHLEPDVLVGQNVVIQDHNHAYEDLKTPIIQQGITKGGTIRIGEGSWVGRGSAILCSRGELRIGRHCVISANSVVTTSIPDYSVVFGMPATIIRQYDPDAGAWRMGAVKRAGNRESVTQAHTDEQNSELIDVSSRQ